MNELTTGLTPWQIILMLILIVNTGIIIATFQYIMEKYNIDIRGIFAFKNIGLIIAAAGVMIAYVMLNYIGLTRSGWWALLASIINILIALYNVDNVYQLLLRRKNND